MQETTNHKFDLFEQGDVGWTYNNDFEYVDKLLPVRAREVERELFEAFEDARFIATDTGAVYDAEDGEWELAEREYARLTVTEQLTIPEVTTDPAEGNIWIRTDIQ